MAVGIERSRVRISGLQINGESFVADLHWERNRLRLVPNSVTRSAPPSISNLKAQAFPGDTLTCGTQFPDRVQLTFDYQDSNGDVLGGRVGVRTLQTRRAGGTNDNFGATTLFRTSSNSLTSPTSTSGTVSLTGCWGGISHIDYTVNLKDADENLAPETLTTSVDIPAAAAANELGGAAQFGGASGMGMPEW